MARYEEDREDILREATALIERIEIQIPEMSETVVAGFRRDGAASFYFGADPVLQFNNAGELRRGYDRGRLIKAELKELVALRRVREEHQVSLYRHPFSPAETSQFLERSRNLLTALLTALVAGTARIGRQVPEGADVISRVRRWLEQNSGPLVIANRPNV